MPIIGWFDVAMWQNSTVLKLFPIGITPTTSSFFLYETSHGYKAGKLVTLDLIGINSHNTQVSYSNHSPTNICLKSTIVKLEQAKNTLKVNTMSKISFCCLY